MKLKDIKKPAQLKEKLLKIYCIDTVHSNHKCNYSSDNPTYGQCAVTSLLVQELFGGEIYKLENENHYYNLINGEVVDLTKDQFRYELNYSNGKPRTRPFDKETIKGFNRLKQLLIDLEEVKKN